MKKAITPSERLQVIGLLTVAADLQRQQDAVERALNTLLEAPPDFSGSNGHITDAMYNDNRRDADQLLERLEITVEDGPAETA